MPSLTWHIVKKDYRYLRPYLDIWWGILVSNALVAAWCVHHIFHQSAADALKNNEQEILTSFNWFFLAMDVLLLALVVDAILKNDSPIDEKAFWRTRPVGGRRMFRAKLMSIGLFCFVVPGAIQAVEHLIFGFSPHEFLLGLEQFAVIQGGMVAVLASAALLFQRTIVGLLTYVCMMIAVLMATAIAPFEQPEAYLIVMVASFRNGWIFPGIIIAAVFWLTALIYTGRRRRIGFFVLTCGIVLLLPAGYYWMNHHKIPPGTFITARAHPDLINLPLTPSALVDQPSYAYSYVWRLHGWLTSPALPELEDSGWVVQFATSQLNWPGERAVELNYNPPNYSNDPVTLINAPVAFAAAGYGRLIGASAESWRNLPLGEVSEQQLDRLKKEPAKLTTRAQLQSVRLQSQVDLPAVAGAIWRSDMAAKRLLNVIVGSPATITLQFDEISPWHSIMFETPEEITGRGVLNSHIYLLYNSKTKECLEGTPAQTGMDSDPIFTWRRVSVTFSFANETDATGLSLPNPNYQTPLDRLRWLADARLVVLQYTPTQNLTVLTTIDSFLLPSKK
jgi:hypothetical protein